MAGQRSSRGKQGVPRAKDVAPEAFGPPVEIARTGLLFYPPLANSGGDRAGSARYATDDSETLPLPVPQTPSSEPAPGDLIVVRDNMGQYWQGPMVISMPVAGLGLHGLLLHARESRRYSCVPDSYGRGRSQWQYADEVSDAEWYAERVACDVMPPRPVTDGEYADALATEAP